MKNPTLCRSLRRLATLAALAGACFGASAYDVNYVLQQQMNQTNQMMQRSLQQSQQLTDTMNRAQNQMLQQRMQDPAVRQSYMQYVQQMQSQGRPPMDFQTYTFQYIYTNGFSREGIAHMNRAEGGNRAREMQSLQGLRDAQANRGQVMQQQRDSYFRNQQEAGRGLMGQSTYYGPNGYQQSLPHTWQNNTYQQHQGQQYYVDQSGRYHVRGSNGWYYPINR